MSVEKIKLKKLNVENCDGWELILALCHWSRKPLLPKPIAEKAYRAIYNKSDGYGEVGYVPTQGFDWSGIRDSSPEAQENMELAARHFLTIRGYKELCYESDER